MELLIIKSGQEYIRFKDHVPLLVSIDKANVFLLNQMEVVQEHVFHIKEQGFTDVCIKKLVLTEEDL
ncbi:MAG: hypothetical protein DRH34_00200 [Deltaproteobacteria bacterium]|nr:MAG: hypothetical protein DRH34_00200 [Deltaproteobacteria bacterium]RLC25353.1 MAG: hypothetical protein DRH93_02030 [Deltaproteobacteria bacterium]